MKTAVLVVLGIVAGWLVATLLVWPVSDYPALDVAAVLVLVVAGGALGYLGARRLGR